MSQRYSISLLDATPPAVKVQSLTLVYRNRGVFWLPSYVTVRMVHATYPNDRANNYIQLVGCGKRIPRDKFDQLVAEGRLVPTDTTAPLVGYLKPSTKAEAQYSEDSTMMDLLLVA